jgi:hypothetical protein
LFAAPGRIVPRLQVAPAQAPLKVGAPKPAGPGSVRVTPVASDGPLFCTSTV